MRMASLFLQLDNPSSPGSTWQTKSLVLANKESERRSTCKIPIHVGRSRASRILAFVGVVSSFSAASFPGLESTTNGTGVVAHGHKMSIPVRVDSFSCLALVLSQEFAKGALRIWTDSRWDGERCFLALTLDFHADGAAHGPRYKLGRSVAALFFGGSGRSSGA